MGRIVAPHGIRGWLKVQPWSEDPATLLSHSRWFLRAPGGSGEWREVAVTEARAHSGGLVAAFRDVATRDGAERLRGFEIGLPRVALAAPRSGEFYRADLEGMQVVNRESVALGRVASVIDNGAHAILRVIDEGGGERLVPFVDAYVDGVDAEHGRIDVDWQPDF